MAIDGEKKFLIGCYVARGFSNVEIAKKLDISTKTVYRYKKDNPDIIDSIHAWVSNTNRKNFEFHKNRYIEFLQNHSIKCMEELEKTDLSEYKKTASLLKQLNLTEEAFKKEINNIKIMDRKNKAELFNINDELFIKYCLKDGNITSDSEITKEEKTIDAPDEAENSTLASESVKISELANNENIQDTSTSVVISLDFPDDSTTNTTVAVTSINQVDEPHDVSVKKSKRGRKKKYPDSIICSVSSENQNLQPEERNSGKCFSLDPEIEEIINGSQIEKRIMPDTK